jgi:hypothetical protein
VVRGLAPVAAVGGSSLRRRSVKRGGETWRWRSSSSSSRRGRPEAETAEEVVNRRRRGVCGAGHRWTGGRRGLIRGRRPVEPRHVAPRLGIEVLDGWPSSF